MTERLGPATFAGRAEGEGEIIGVMARIGPKRPRQELVDHLKRQMKALDASAANYDSGEEWEAERLASTVFNLVFDGGDIVSLLSQLEVKNSLKFVSSGGVAIGHGLAPADVAFPALVIFEAGPTGAGFKPQLGDGPRLGDGPPVYPSVPFEDWWKNGLIYQEKASGHLNRMRLVLALRHKDGGGHIGALTDGIYIHLKKGAGWQIGREDGSVEPVSNIVAALMRQVAWEVKETLKQLGGDFRLAG